MFRVETNGYESLLPCRIMPSHHVKRSDFYGMECIRSTFRMFCKITTSSRTWVQLYIYIYLLPFGKNTCQSYDSVVPCVMSDDPNSRVNRNIMLILIVSMGYDIFACSGLNRCARNTACASECALLSSPFQGTWVRPVTILRHNYFDWLIRYRFAPEFSHWPCLANGPHTLYAVVLVEFGARIIKPPVLYFVYQYHGGRRTIKLKFIYEKSETVKGMSTGVYYCRHLFVRRGSSQFLLYFCLNVLSVAASRVIFSPLNFHDCLGRLCGRWYVMTGFVSFWCEIA